jgi:hypothetical protein
MSLQSTGYRSARTVDTLLQLKDAGAIAASAAAQVGGSAKVLDLGTGFVKGNVMVDVTAMDVASGDEKYEIEVQLSSDSGFATGNVVAGELKLGDSTVAFGTVDSVIGRYMVPCTNEFGGTQYRYMRLYTRVGGTSPSINYVAYLVKP